MNIKVSLILKWEDLEEHYHLHYVLTLFAAPIFLSLNLNLDNLTKFNITLKSNQNLIFTNNKIKIKKN